MSRCILGLVAVFSCGLLAGCAYGTDALDFEYDWIEDDTFPVWDLDGNGLLDATEWHIGFDESRVFENWDDDDDAFIDFAENDATSGG